MRTGDHGGRGILVLQRQPGLHRVPAGAGAAGALALPGDTVQITEGILYVNDVPQPTPDGFSLMEDAGNAAVPITLQPGEYFVLGDNRNHSIDSRFAEVGIIPAASIAGKVITGRTPFR